MILVLHTTPVELEAFPSGIYLPIGGNLKYFGSSVIEAVNIPTVIILRVYLLPYIVVASHLSKTIVSGQYSRN